MRNLTTIWKALTISSLAGLFIYITPSAMAITPSAAASARAFAEVVVPVSIININPSGLAFGYIVPDNGGTVTISPAGVRSFTGVQVLNSSAFSAARFRVSGDVGNTYSISLPASATLFSGSNTMQVTAFTSNPSGAGALDATTGEQDLHVGATLNVGRKQVPGIYQGTFNVTVAYN